ncbi:MAG: hemerythrin domain-containing protein [Alteromonadaceae bacterium]|nr:hemerythrin domain-containing protein [Alteromonadaceae bacterium]
MSTIVEFMTSKHRECDDIFSEAESAVAKENWDEATIKWQAFTDELELHLQAEETILFPQFEQATGMTAGPTQVMRMEHEQMRALVNDLNKDLIDNNKISFLGNSETLMVLMQQHNMKEEMMLYPMTEQHLPNVTEVSNALRQHCHSS